MKRPLAIFGAVFLASGTSVYFLPQWALLSIAAFGILFFVGLYIMRKRTGADEKLKARLGVEQKIAAVALTAFFCACALCTAHTKFVYSRVYSYGGAAVTISGEVRNAAQQNESGAVAEAAITVRYINGQKLNRPIKLTVYSAGNLAQGDLFDAEAVIAPYVYNAKNLYQISRGVSGTAKLTNITNTGTSNSVFYKFAALQAAMSNSIRTALGGDIGGVASAVSVGDKAYLSSFYKTAFRASGLSHVLVVSGLHLTIVAAAVYMLLKRAFKSEKLISAITIAAILCFMLLSGLAPSVVRAGICSILHFSAVFFNRRSDLPTSLGAAAVLIVAANPYAAVDMGVLLSFACVYSLIAFNAIKNSYIKNNNKFYMQHKVAADMAFTVATPAFITICTLPVMVLFGGSVSVVSVLANLLVLPLIPFAVISGLITGALGLFSPLYMLFKVGGVAAYLVYGLITAVARILGALPFATVHVGGTFAAAVIYGTIFFIAVSVYIFRGFRAKIVLPAVALILAFAIGGYLLYTANAYKVAVVGNTANANVVVTKNAKAIVLLRSEADAYEVKQYLETQNVFEVEAIFSLCGEEIAQNKYIKALKCDNWYVLEQNSYDPSVFLGGVYVDARAYTGGALVYFEAGGKSFALANKAPMLDEPLFVDYFICGSAQPRGIDALYALKGQNAMYSGGFYGAATAVIDIDELCTVFIKPNKVTVKAG